VIDVFGRTPRNFEGKPISYSGTLLFFNLIHGSHNMFEQLLLTAQRFLSLAGGASQLIKRPSPQCPKECTCAVQPQGIWKCLIFFYASLPLGMLDGIVMIHASSK